MITTPDGPTRPELSDDELLEQARGGSAPAFAALWRRHAGVAYSVARTFRYLDADDIVSEAFTRVLEAIQSGKGPRTAFRPYLTVTVLNIGRYQFNRQPAVSERERDATTELAAPSSEDLAVDALEQSAAATAFLSLPTRWQEVLWYSEVDGLKPRTISGYIGIPANAVSALIVRAKRGLRDAWITAQLATARTPDCVEALREMGAYTRGALSKRAQDKLDAHLAACPTCPAALREAERLSDLALTLLPVFAGAAGAASYSSLQPPPALPEAFVPASRDDSNDTTSAAAAVAAGVSTQRRPLAVTAWVTGAVLLTGGVTGAAIVALHEDPARVSAPSSSVPAAPLPGDVAMPAPTPASTETPPPQGNEGAPDAPSAPSGPSSPVPPAPTASLAPTPPAAPPTETPLGAPAAVLQQSDARLYPRAHGVDARPGAKIELIDDVGAIVGEATVNHNGFWSARVISGTVGTHSIRARQVVGSATSASSAPLTYTVTEPPAILSPAAGQIVSGAEFVFSYAAPAGTVLQREIEGVTAQQTIVTPANGMWREYFTAPPGSHTVKVRYVDPQSGDFGPTNAYTFTAK